MKCWEALLTVADAYTPARLRTQYKDLHFSGIYAFYARPGSLPQVAPECVQRSHHSTDGSGWFLAYVGQARRTSDKRFLGVRCSKHCGKNTYEAQSQLRLGLCGVLLESWNLAPCFKCSKKDEEQKFIWLPPEQKHRLTRWCDENILLKFAGVPETRTTEIDLLGDTEVALIQQYLPLLNTDRSAHPFTPRLKELKRKFLTDGLKRPYPRVGEGT